MSRAELLDINRLHSGVAHKEAFEIDPEQLRRPLLERAGIIDLNHAFNVLPDELIFPYKSYPKLDKDHRDIYSFLSQLRSEVFHTTGQKYAQVGRYDFQGEHFLYPVVSGGFIDEVSKTELFRRQFGIRQLGLLVYYPLPATHSRGEHAIYTTVNMARTLQSLYDTDRVKLASRLRKDFESERFYNEQMSDDQVMKLAVDLAVLTGMSHDIATPPGGDTIKYLLGLDEEKEVEWLLLGNHSTLEQERTEFIETIAKQGLRLDHIRFAIQCVQGKSGSLIGDMIHPVKKDCMDWDRIAYTLLDAEVATILGNEIPTKLYPQELSDAQTGALTIAFLESIGILEDPHVIGALETISEHRLRPPTNYIDPTEDYILDDNLDLVNTKPEKLTWVTSLRIFMVAEYYNGGKMLGFETKFQRRLKWLLDRGIGTDILNKRSLISMTSNQLFKALKSLNDVELNEMIDDIYRAIALDRFDSAILDDARDISEIPEVIAAYPLKISSGLDTKVIYEGKTITLQEYIEDTGGSYRSVPAGLTAAGLKMYMRKQVVIWEVDRDDPERTLLV